MATITGGPGDETLSGGGGDDVVSGEGGNDNLHGGGGDDSVVGGDGDDTVVGDEGNDTLEGGAGNDSLYGQEGHDTLRGGAGNDSLRGSVGNDSLAGDHGEDTLVGGEGDDTLDGGADNDTLYGQEGNDSIDGGDGDDAIHGEVGDDDLHGGNDADTFIVRDNFGDDTIVGGEGGNDYDVIDMSGLSGPVTVSYTGDEAGTITDGTDTITFSEIERLILTDHADLVVGDADSVGINVDGQGGDDSIDGGSGNDTIAGGLGDDSIDGNAGDDSLVGGDGSDSIYGDDGADTISGGAGNDALDGDAGADYLGGGDGADTLDGGNGNDILLGQGGNDELYGGAGADTLDGGDGNDEVFGGGGNDSISGGSSDDTIGGGGGDDTISGGLGDDVLRGNLGNDVFTYAPGDGHDTIADFNSGNTGTLNDGDSTNNDFIDLSGYYDHISELHADHADDGVLNQSNATDSGGNATDYSDNTQFGSGSMRMQGASADDSSFTQENTGVVCFTSGTSICTPRGEVLIDDLNVGDFVITMDNGPQRIAWIGRRHVTRSELLQNDRLHPVLIKQGVLGAARDLLVSRQHGMLLGQDHLGRAVHLAKTMQGIRIAAGKRQVTYIHLMFEAHQIIFAEGIPSESFYPGRLALEMLSSTSREELMIAFPKLSLAKQQAGVLSTYGDTARVVLENKKAVGNWLREGTDTVRKEIRKWDADLALERYNDLLFKTKLTDQVGSEVCRVA